MTLHPSTHEPAPDKWFWVGLEVMSRQGLTGLVDPICTRLGAMDRTDKQRKGSGGTPMGTANRQMALTNER